MKAAILISGQARTFGRKFADAKGGAFRVFESQYWQVYRHYPDAHFFVSIAQDEDAASMELLRTKFSNVSIEYVVQPTISEPEGAASDLQAATPWRISAPVQNILRAYWANERVWDFAQHCEGFDLVIRMRPDLFFQRFDPPAMPAMGECLVPWWGRYGGVNDRFAIMHQFAAENYFTVYSLREKLWTMGCPLHPETMQAAAMELRGTKISHTLSAEFCTVRKDGTLVQPVYLDHDYFCYMKELKETPCPT